MSRLVGIPAALAVVVVVPVVVAAVPSKPEAPEPPAPIEKTLTVQTESETTKLRVRTAGSPPAEGTRFILATANGLETAHVKRSEDNCFGEPFHQVPLGPTAAQTWCLELTSMPAHEQVTGTVTGEPPAGRSDPTTALALTVDRREPFLCRPAAVLLASILLGLLLAVLGPWLNRRIGRGRLGLLLARNELAPVAQRIDGLADWVVLRRAANQSDADLRALLQALLQSGPAGARIARGSLRDLLSGGALPQDHPLARLADREAKRPDHDISDFYDDAGERVPHPAGGLTLAVRDMKTLKRDIDQAADQMRSGLEKHCWPNGALSGALGAWSRADTEAEMAAAHKAHMEFVAAVDKAAGDPGCRIGEGPRISAPAEDAFGVMAADAMALDSATFTTAMLASWLAVTVVAVLAALAFAFVTVAVAAYDAKPAFGSWQDYFALASAGLASGAAATVLGLIAPWRSTSADA